MTLELTPEQRDIIVVAVQTRLDGCNAALQSLWDSPSAQTILAAEKQRLASLHDLLNVPNTTVILHQP